MDSSLHDENIERAKHRIAMNGATYGGLCWEGESTLEDLVAYGVRFAQEKTTEYGEYSADVSAMVGEHKVMIYITTADVDPESIMSYRSEKYGIDKLNIIVAEVGGKSVEEVTAYIAKFLRPLAGSDQITLVDTAHEPVETASNKSIKIDLYQALLVDIAADAIKVFVTQNELDASILEQELKEIRDQKKGLLDRALLLSVACYKQEVSDDDEDLRKFAKYILHLIDEDDNMEKWTAHLGIDDLTSPDMLNGN